MKPKTKKSQMKKQPKKKAGKMMKDKSVKQEVRVNVQSSGGGGSGGYSVPSSQPFQNPILSSFKQAEKTGENVDIKNLTDIIKKLGVGLSEKTAQTSTNAFQNIINKSNNDDINRPESNIESENINYDDILEQAKEINNPNDKRFEYYENLGMGAEDTILEQRKAEAKQRKAEAKRIAREQAEAEEEIRKRAEEMEAINAKSRKEREKKIISSKE